MIRTKTLLGTCAAIVMGFGPVVAQEKAPAPMPAPKGAPAAAAPAPAHGQWTPATCCDTCCNDCNSGGCYVDAEAVFLWANSDQLHAFTINRTGDANEQRVFNPDVETCPRITVGWKNCDGMGLRIRYFRFNTRYSDESATVGGDIVTLERTAFTEDEGQAFFGGETSSAGDSYVARQELRLWTLDVEGTKDMEVCGSNVTLGAGIRYANTRSLFQLGHFDAEGTIQGDSYQIEQKFRAFGPTLSAEARSCMCGVTMVVGLRTSILITGVNREVTAADLNGQTFVDKGDSGLWISELFLGGEKCWETCNGKISIRGGYEAQYWANAGIASRNASDFNQGSPLFLDGFSVGVRWEK